MSLAWYIVPEKKVRGLDHHVNGKSLAHAPEKTLEKLFSELNVTPLMDFHSVDPEELAEFFDGDMPEDLNTPEEWFMAADGLQSVRALLEHLRKNPKAIKNSADVIDDLADFERVLAALAKAKVRWHLAIDI